MQGSSHFLSELVNKKIPIKSNKKKPKKPKIPLLFVSYQYTTENSWGFGNIVFKNTKQPKNIKEYELLNNKVKNDSGHNNSVLMNWIVMK